MKPIYLDHNATTPVDPRVKQAMEPFFEADFGNPSSQSHAYGWKAQMAVDKSRAQVAKLFNAGAKQVLFTSGATESNNLAILGTLDYLLEQGEKPHFITSATEHKAVLEVFALASKRGAEISIAPVTRDGVVDMNALQGLIKPNTRMISIMTANNEIGTINPLREISELCNEKEIIFHTDAAQAVGRTEINFEKLKIDMLSLSGHKIYGPKGVGALIVRPINRKFEIRPIIVGGEQECGIRPGTLNVPGIVGLAKACEIFVSEMDAEIEKLSHWRDSLFQTLSACPCVVINGSSKQRLCNNISFSCENLHPDEILEGLSGLAYSSSSACTSGNPKPSHVLKAIGHSDTLARSTVRIGIGRFNTSSEIEIVAKKLKDLLSAK